MGSRENINYNNNLRNGGRLEERSAEGGGGGHWSEHIRQVGIQVNSNATRTTENDGGGNCFLFVTVVYDPSYFIMYK